MISIFAIQTLPSWALLIVYVVSKLIDKLPKVDRFNVSGGK